MTLKFRNCSDLFSRVFPEINQTIMACNSECKVLNNAFMTVLSLPAVFSNRKNIEFNPLIRRYAARKRLKGVRVNSRHIVGLHCYSIYRRKLALCFSLFLHGQEAEPVETWENSWENLASNRLQRCRSAPHKSLKTHILQ